MSYSYQERILVGSSSSSVIRLETLAEWRSETRVSPFSSLGRLLEGATSDLKLSIQIASRASQQFPQTELHIVPLLGTEDLPVGPAGFWMKIETSADLQTVQVLVKNLTKNRLITTPLEGSSWDVDVDVDISSKKNGISSYQIFLPNIGSAWSADSLQQIMIHSTGSCDNGFFGLSAMEWSKMLVEGTTRNKIMWWKIRKTASHNQVGFGVQFETQAGTLPLFTSEASCHLGTRNIFQFEASSPGSYEYQLNPVQNTSSQSDVSISHATPLVTVDQVLRRQRVNQGKLEVWISTPDSGDCQMHYRQLLPFFLTPTWESLKISAAGAPQPRVSVEWKDDLSSVLTVVADQTPPALLISFEYEPSFLSLDDFPGDPNRGRELPPAVVTFTCPQKEFTVYSNSALVLPPVPDMSMPFNVLSLACSLYAYIVGSIVTLLVKRASEKIKYKLHPEKRPKSKARKLKEKIMSKFTRNIENKVIAGGQSEEAMGVSNSDTEHDACQASTAE